MDGNSLLPQAEKFQQLKPLFPEVFAETRQVGIEHENEKMDWLKRNYDGRTTWEWLRRKKEDETIRLERMNNLRGRAKAYWRSQAIAAERSRGIVLFEGILTKTTETIAGAGLFVEGFAALCLNP